MQPLTPTLSDLLASSPRWDSPIVKRWLSDNAPQLKHLSHHLQVACALKNLDDVPSCPIVPTEEVLFLKHLRQFAPVGKTAWQLVKHDTNIKTHWLKWLHLLQVGLSLQEALQLHRGKKLHFIREYLSSTVSLVDVQQRLISDQFTVERAQELVSELDFNSFSSIRLFSDTLAQIKATKNVELAYFTARGHSTPVARLLLREFFKAGSLATKKKVDNDAEYAAWFRGTRLPGLHAQQRASVMELAIGEELLRRGLTVEKRTTHITSRSRLAQQHDRSWFCHDFFVPQLNMIIEYNGKYWHSDRDFELQKAAYVLSVTGCRYTLLWEEAFQSAADYVDWLLNSSEAFSSTDPTDVINLKIQLHAAAKETRLDTAFLDVADRLAELSHCQSKKVAALAVKDGRIVGTGINGSITGAVNCDEVFPGGVTIENREEHREWSRFNEVHAEENLVSYAARLGGAGLQGCTVYSSLQPCQKCSTYLASVGAARIVYRHSYDMGDVGFSESLFRRCGIIFDKLGDQTTDQLTTAS